MVESKLDIILNFIKKGTGAKDASKEVNKLEKSTKDATKETKGFNLAQTAAKIGLAAVTVQLLKQLPQLADLGFKYKNAQIALAAYAGSAEEATAITDAITEASGFAVSKMEAVTNATRLLSLGLASNAEEAAQFTKIAITLGATMGKDVQGAFEEFSLLLANQSILRLDTYGISGAKVREEMARLAAVFPEMDRSARFTNATFTIAEEKMAKLEKAGFQATSEIDRLGAEFRDAKLALAEFVAAGLFPVLDGLRETEDAIQSTADSIVGSVDSYEEYIQKLREVGAVGRGGANAQFILTEAQFEVAKSAQEAAASTEELVQVEEEMILTAGGVNELLQEQVFLSKALSLGMGGSLTKATKKWQESLDAVAASGGETIEKQNELIIKSNELRDSLENTTAELIFQAAAADLDAEASLLLARELGLVDEATFAVAQEAQRLRIQYDENKLSAERFAESAGILAREVNALTGKNIEITVDTLQANQAIAGLSSNLDRIGPAGVNVRNSRRTGSGGRGFQDGGQFQIPDNGQRGDSVPVSFMAEPGETVTVTPNDGGGSGGNNVSITNNISSDVDVAFFQQVLEDLL